MPVFSRANARQVGFQILKRFFSEKANTIPPLTPKGSPDISSIGCPGSSSVKETAEVLP